MIYKQGVKTNEVKTLNSVLFIIKKKKNIIIIVIVSASSNRFKIITTISHSSIGRFTPALHHSLTTHLIPTVTVRLIVCFVHGTNHRSFVDALHHKTVRPTA